MTTAQQLFEQQPNLSVVPPEKDWSTMYDLPSEDPQEPGLPDELHRLQPRLLSATLRLPDEQDCSQRYDIDLGCERHRHGRELLLQKPPDVQRIRLVRPLLSGSACGQIFD